MHFSETELMNQIAHWLWPLVRLSGFFIALPVMSSHSVPVRVRVLFAFMLSLPIAPLLPKLPNIELLSLAGFLEAMQQFIIGLIGGSILQIVFAAIVFAGQSVANSMGLGFAAMVDPQSGVQVPVIAQFYLILGTLLFLQMDGHLLLIRILTDSFTTLPIGQALEKDDFWTLAIWSSHLFAGGVLLSMPVLVGLLFVNLSMGVASRAAPQLNIFSVGFPVSLLLGLFLVWVTLTDVLHLFGHFLEDSYDLVAQLFGVQRG